MSANVGPGLVGPGVALVAVEDLPGAQAYPLRWLVRHGDTIVMQHRSAENAEADALSWPGPDRPTVQVNRLAPDGWLAVTAGSAAGSASKCVSTRWVRDTGHEVRDGEAMLTALSGRAAHALQRVWPHGTIRNEHVEMSQRAWLNGTDAGDVVDGFRVECDSSTAGHGGACRFRDWVWDRLAGTASPT